MEKTGIDIHYPVWAEIDCSAIRHNFHLIRSHIENTVKIMAVIKANAYGHGAIQVARLLAQEGVDAFGVARLCEAQQLREENIVQPILVFGYTPPGNASILASNDIIQTVYSYEYAEALHCAAKAAGCRVRIHLKIDTGMGRLGFLTPGSFGKVPILKMLHRISGFETLLIEGVYTHFASSDAAVLDMARKQLKLFQAALNDLGLDTLYRHLCVHAANSAATMVMPDAHFDMVRPGLILYGLKPSQEMDSSVFDLHPAMSIKSVISSVKHVPEGFSVSYGHSYVTTRETVIATVPVGYADGYPRLLSSRGTMLVCGARASVIGRVCMDQLMLDVTHIPDVCESEEVVILGRQGKNEISADELASMTDTINYEVVSRILARVPRRYIE